MQLTTTMLLTTKTYNIHCYNDNANQYGCSMCTTWIPIILQWNPSKTDIIGIKGFGIYSGVFLAIVVDHALAPTIMANHDKATST